MKCTICDTEVHSRRLPEHLTSKRHVKNTTPDPPQTLSETKRDIMEEDVSCNEELVDEKSNYEVSDQSEKDPREVVRIFLKDSPFFTRDWRNIIQLCASKIKSGCIRKYKERYDSLGSFACGACGILQESTAALNRIDLSE